ncbi:WD-40 repeat-containing protein, partial [Reticulomyxa filosa]
MLYKLKINYRKILTQRDFLTFVLHFVKNITNKFCLYNTNNNFDTNFFQNNNKKFVDLMILQFNFYFYFILNFGDKNINGVDKSFKSWVDVILNYFLNIFAILRKDIINDLIGYLFETLGVFFVLSHIFDVPFIELKKKSSNISHYMSSNATLNEKNKTMTTLSNEKQTSAQLPLAKEQEIQIIIQHWIRILNIKLGWINNFDKLVVDYAINFFIFDTFHSSSKLLKTFTGHTNYLWSIDYSVFDDKQFICSGSEDNTVCVWDIGNIKKIQSFNRHSNPVYCVKFSPYHYHNNHQN